MPKRPSPTRKKKSVSSSRLSLSKLKPTKKGIFSKKGILFILGFALVGVFLLLQTFALTPGVPYKGKLDEYTPTNRFTITTASGNVSAKVDSTAKILGVRLLRGDSNTASQTVVEDITPSASATSANRRQIYEFNTTVAAGTYTIEVFIQNNKREGASTKNYTLIVNWPQNANTPGTQPTATLTSGTAYKGTITSSTADRKDSFPIAAGNGPIKATVQSQFPNMGIRLSKDGQTIVTDTSLGTISGGKKGFEVSSTATTGTYLVEVFFSKDLKPGEKKAYTLTATWPNRPTTPTTCPPGQTGTPPNCVTPPTTCPAGQVGTPPNCVTPPPVNIAPVTVLTSPTSGQVSGTVNVAATATDADGIRNVEFLIDGQRIGELDTSSPYQVSWNTINTPNGTHTITARATDTTGLIGTASIPVTVFNQGSTPPPSSGVKFSADFSTASDFYDRFDYGYSGPNPWDWGNGSGNGATTNFSGDHNTNCEGPTTSRGVRFTGDRNKLGYDQLFWHCSPGNDPAKGHLMTAVDTISYNIAWFAPKQTFSNVSKVCWDINATQMSKRKWTQVLFVDARAGQDATRWRSVEGGGTDRNRRGTGGYDLGFTSPDFQDPNGPRTGAIPESGTLAGFKSLLGVGHWFQNQSQWTSGTQGPEILNITDKAARYQNCLQNMPNNTVRWSLNLPGGGTRNNTFPGQIPQHPVRVVFQDDNYDPPKDNEPGGGGMYNSNVLTWHWDNILVE